MKQQSNQDQYGFTFWLKWILWFAGSFILSAIFWTTLMSKVFGGVQGKELTITWSIALFGTWFLIVIPFMRKKERIWKRLNVDEERAVDVWLKGMGAFLAAIIISALVWSLIYKTEILAIHEGVNKAWLKGVLGSWLILALPFLIFLYKQAETIFKSAHERQTQTGVKFKTLMIEKEKRTLPDALVQSLNQIKPIAEKGHIVSLKLKGGKKIENVFVRSKEILGIYDVEKINFMVNEIESLEPVAPENIPLYEEEKWLRLDGRA